MQRQQRVGEKKREGKREREREREREMDVANATVFYIIRVHSLVLALSTVETRARR